MGSTADGVREVIGIRPEPIGVRQHRTETGSVGSSATP